MTTSSIPLVSSLTDAMVRLSRQTDLDTLLALVTVEAMDLLGADGVAVLRHRPKGWHVEAASDLQSLRAAKITVGSAERAAVSSPGWRFTMSLPLATDEHEFGSLELYFAARDPADCEAGEAWPDVVRAFVDHVSLAVDRVVNIDQLHQAVAARHRIGQAQGILMVRYGLTSEASFQVLRRYSQHCNVKLRRVADIVILTGALPESDDVA